MLFGGIGKNFMNPALGARAFMMASWAGFMTTWTAPHANLPLFGNVTVTDAISTATPLATLKTGAVPADTGLLEMLLGQTGGVIGETSALALLAGGVYLLWRKVITINIPAAYILTVAVITFLFPLSGDVSRVQWMLSQVLSGGLMLGAIFMATDYVTSPVTPKGQIIFGVGCGLLTVFIRYFGGLPEGVSYSILIMNTLVLGQSTRRPIRASSAISLTRLRRRRSKSWITAKRKAASYSLSSYWASSRSSVHCCWALSTV